VFEIPTVAELAASIERALRVGQGLDDAPITCAPRQADLPLSFAQQRLWMLDQLAEGRPVNTVPLAVRLTGPLDVAALGRSLNEVIRRHEILRTGFGSPNGYPAQIISQDVTLNIPQVDLSELPASERDGQARGLIADGARWPFDLSRPPLMRVLLLRLGDEDHMVLLAMHHIISDGWSGGILVNELASLYESFSAGKPSPLAELPLQYADFACWQREQLQGEVLERHLRYWEGRLADAPTVLELPTDRPRTSLQTFRGANQSFRFSAALTESLNALSSREGVTLHMTLLAAFQTLLYRYSGQARVSVGGPISIRNQRETEGLIGCFLNTLVYHTDLSGNPSFRDLLCRVREVALGAYAHQDLPFEKLVEHLRPDRSMLHNPLFQVWFVLQNLPDAGLKAQELTLTPVEVETGTAMFDLTLTIIETDQGLSGGITYNTDLFDADTVAEMIAHFELLLEAASGHPEWKLLDIPLVRQQDRLTTADANPQEDDSTEVQFAF
jgi:hypothetical protein